MASNEQNNGAVSMILPPRHFCRCLSLLSKLSKIWSLNIFRMVAGSLSSILSPDGTGLSQSGKLLQKSVRANDRLFRYDTTDNNIDEASEAVLRDIAASDELYGDGKSDKSYRHDTVKDINWTMTIVANSIKVVSAVLTILAVDSTER